MLFSCGMCASTKCLKLVYYLACLCGVVARVRPAVQKILLGTGIGLGAQL